MADIISRFGIDMKELIISNIKDNFPKASERVAVWAETDKYRWKEDISVWNQKKGKTAPQYEAHFDGEFVCFIDSSKSKQYNLTEFLKGLKKLYVRGQIFVHKEMYDIKRAEQESKNKADVLVIPKAENEAEGMIVESIKRSAKKRGRKVKTK